MTGTIYHRSGFIFPEDLKPGDRQHSKVEVVVSVFCNHYVVQSTFTL